ncbi:MAG TPA: nuclease-related domain-containing protein [Rhodanobacter sp.]|nr:nuclease-related domain-containing protein [Rhodanobacter sp.]
MLIKQADDHAEELAQLEQLAKSSIDDAAKYAAKDLAIRKAGLKGESESAYLIDFDFAGSAKWAVIHDLRLEYNGRTAQIDHLLINHWMDCYVLESKHFHAGIKITEDGEFMRWNDYKHTYEGMPSPLQQNERHITVLRDVMSTLELPTRLGFCIAFEFQTFVLVSSTSRIDRPRKFDTSRVIKADQVKERIWRDFDKEHGRAGMMKAAARVVSSDTVRDVAQQLANLHRPAKWPMPAIIKDAAVTAKPSKSVTAPTVVEPSTPAKSVKAVAPPAAAAHPFAGGPQCKECHGHQGSIQYGKYGYYFKCAQCHANTAIKFTCLPGHDPRLRKAGNQFYRDCAECHSSSLYFTNP